MKILYITHECYDDFNGASRSLLSIIDALNKNNEIYVFVPGTYGRIVDELKRRDNVRIIERTYHRWKVYKPRNKKEWFKLKFDYYSKKRNENKKVAKEIAELCMKEQIQLIHSNSSVIDLGALLNRITGIPHIWHLREFGEEDFNMYSLIPNKKFYKVLDKNSSQLIAISMPVLEKYKKYSSHIKLIYNGINFEKNVDFIEKIRYSQNKKSFNVLISGMISENKGQVIAIRAIKQLIELGYSDVYLYIAGKGDFNILVNEYKDIENHVKVLGFVNNMTELRSKMNLELMCSKSEAFGRVTVEAMYCYLPVIGANSGGTKDLIRNGFNGFLFDPNNEKDLSEKIEVLINDRKSLMEMSINAHKYVYENFNFSHCKKELEELYNDTLNN